MKHFLKFLLAILMGFLVGYFARPKPQFVFTTEHRTDTVRVEQPMPIQTDTFFRKVLVKVPADTVVTTVYVKDSIYISLPFERKQYEDSTYKAVVSGYKPELESFEVYDRRSVVCVEKMPPSLSPYVSMGIGLKGSISIGGGVFIRDKDAFGLEYENRELQFKYVRKF